jgi:hypothetical protein
MSIQMKCKFCGHVWDYKGSAAMATCPGCMNKIRVRSLPDADPQPKAPPAVKKMLAKKKAQDEPVGPSLSSAIEKAQASDGQPIRGQVLERSTGRVIEVETIITPAPVPVKSRTPFTPVQLHEGIVCDLCHRPIRSPKMGYFLDGQPLHGRCLVDRALLECGGDLQRAAKVYDLPLKALEKRAAILQSKGRLPKESNLA